MEIFLRILALCLCVALFSLVLKKQLPEWSMLLSLAVVLCAIGGIGQQLSLLVAPFQAVLDHIALSETVFLPVLRTLGIALTAKIGGEVCRDAGQTALASLIDCSGSLCALLAAMPLLQEIVQLFMEWL